MRKGSITVYLCLVLCVIVTLIFAAIDSARYSCGRALVSMAAEEGLFSLFGEYDRILYDHYGLLVIDSGFGGAEPKAGVLLEEAVDYMKKTAVPGNAGLFSSDLFRIDLDGKAVTGYVLATDSGGEPLRQQIHELMVRKTGADVLSALFARYTGASALFETAESSDDSQMDRLKAEYENQKKAAAEKQAEEGGAAESIQAEVPADFKNPIENIYRLRKLGIMAWAVPDPSGISAQKIDKNTMPSSRSLKTGMGIMPESAATIEDRFLLAKFITDYFPCFTDNEGNGMKYQSEYAVAGKSSDIENLRSVLNRLLLIREALNASYLTLDQEKQAEAYAAATVICAALLIPEFIELVKGVLILCWAFGESMIDLRTLLAGGKVPLMKDAASWNLSLEDLAGLGVAPAVRDNRSGFDYKEYLCILLMLKGSSKLMTAATDLLEYNRRTLSGESGFSIDTCICSMEIQIDGCIGSREFSLIRRYGYDV